MSIQPLYGVPIYGAIASGDLNKMKELEAAAEKHLKEHGDIGAALAVLKAEIAKLHHHK